MKDREWAELTMALNSFGWWFIIIGWATGQVSFSLWLKIVIVVICVLIVIVQLIRLRERHERT